MEKRDNTILWAVVACLLWSTAYAAIKIGLQYDTPLHFAGARFTIAGLMILPFTVRPRAYMSMVWEHRKLVLWVILLQTIVTYVLFYLGMDLVPGALGAVIVGSQPLFTAIVAAIMHKGEYLTKPKIVTIIFGIAGVVLISAGRQAFRLGDAIELLGILMILIANIATAASNVIVSVNSKGMNPFVLSSVSLFAGGLLIWLFSLSVEEGPSANLPYQYWLTLLWLSFMAAAAMSIWYKLLQRSHVKVSELNLWKFLIPVIGAILSWLLVPGEKPDWLTVSGMILITSTLILFFKNGKKKLQKK